MGSYEKNKGRSSKERYVQLNYWLLESPAWLGLSFKARALYISFKQRYNGGNNGYVHMSVREVQDVLKCANGTASKALAELIDKGFIKYRFKGTFSHKVHRSSEFILTEYEYNGQKPTKDFMGWRPKK